MNYNEAKALLDDLRGYQQNGSLASHKSELNALYHEICGKSLPNCKCVNRMDDAIIEIYLKLKDPKIMEIMEKKAKLVKGVYLIHVPNFDGTIYNNSNLTDEVALAFLAQHPERKDWFEVLPDEPKIEEAAEAVEAPKKTRKSKKA